MSEFQFQMVASASGLSSLRASVAQLEPELLRLYGIQVSPDGLDIEADDALSERMARLFYFLGVWPSVDVQTVESGQGQLFQQLRERLATTMHFYTAAAQAGAGGGEDTEMNDALLGGDCGLSLGSGARGGSAFRAGGAAQPLSYLQTQKIKDCSALVGHVVHSGGKAAFGSDNNLFPVDVSLAMRANKDRATTSGGEGSAGGGPSSSISSMKQEAAHWGSKLAELQESDTVVRATAADAAAATSVDDEHTQKKNKKRCTAAVVCGGGYEEKASKVSEAALALRELEGTLADFDACFMMSLQQRVAAALSSNRHHAGQSGGFSSSASAGLDHSTIGSEMGVQVQAVKGLSARFQGLAKDFASMQECAGALQLALAATSCTESGVDVAKPQSQLEQLSYERVVNTMRTSADRLRAEADCSSEDTAAARVRSRLLF